MILHKKISNKELRSKIKACKICFAGNRNLKIYGTLTCASGKKMKKENRVFFSTEEEALERYFRPCGHCLKHKYQSWKNETV